MRARSFDKPRTTTMHIKKAVSVFLVAGGCASRQPLPNYVRATPMAEPAKPPAVIEVPRPLPLPGQLKRIPVPRHTTKAASEKGGPAWEVIDHANRRAASGPDSEAYFNAIMTYDFTPGALYQIYAAPLRLTAIQLQPGEKVIGKPAVGDSIRWIMAIGRSGSGAPDTTERQYLYLKPTRPGLQSTLAINTDRRTYYLELHSFEDTYMAAVEFRYPHDELAEIEAAKSKDDALAKTTTATNVNLEAINFAYRVTVEKGKPSWVPEQIFDDGHKTFIRFPASMLNREAPALFVLSSTNEVQLVNYRVKNDFYVVDRLIEKAELRVGQKDQEIVRIARTR
jgi:P-type conjugative transfer protein TrbG